MKKEKKTWEERERQREREREREGVCVCVCMRAGMCVHSNG